MKRRARAGALAALSFFAPACVVEPVAPPSARVSVRASAQTEPVAAPPSVSLGFIYEQYPGAPGLLVKAVQPGHAADRAGIRKGDCLMGIDGRPLAPDVDFAAFFRPFAPGQHVTVDLVREGRPLTVEAVLDPTPPPFVWRGPGVPTLVFTTSPVCMKSVR